MLSFAVILSRNAAGQEDTENVIKNRISNFREIGTAFKNIGDELKAREPSVVRIQASAQLINDYGAYLLDWFPPGSEPPPKVPKSWLDRIRDLFSSEGGFVSDNEVESHAKLEIWTERSRFEQAYRKFEAEADGMWQASQHGQIAAMTAQFRKLEESCKGCHDVFREELD